MPQNQTYQSLEQTRQFWDLSPCTGQETLAKRRAYRYRSEPWLPGMIRRITGENPEILEIGCGMGTDGLEFCTVLPDTGSYLGIDYSSESVVAAKQAEIARVDELSRQARREILTQESALRTEQSREKLNVAALSTRRSWIAHLKRMMLLHKQMRTEFEDELKHAAQALSRTRTQTQIVEKLRERRWAAYRKQRDRREQSESDELARQLLYEPDRSVLDRIG